MNAGMVVRSIALPLTGGYRVASAVGLGLRAAGVHMTRCLALLALAAIGLSGCAQWRGKSDQLCAEIVGFANATPPGETHEVQLGTDWGGAYSGRQVTYAKHCECGTYPPGNKLCEYLIKNSSIESSEIDFERALSCMGEHVYTPRFNFLLDWDKAKVSTLIMPRVVEGIRVSVEFDATKDAPPALTIRAAREPLPKASKK